MKDLLLDGSNFGQEAGQYCYIPVFRSFQDQQQDTWFVGSLFLSDYIFVFDNTHYDEHKYNFTTIAIGKKSNQPVEIGLQTQYDTKYEKY